MIAITSGRARFGRLFCAFLAAWLVLTPAAPDAHEIPTDVLVQAYLRPADGRMTMLIRVPLSAMRDINFPMREPGFLILPDARPAVRTAAVLWVAGGLVLYEDGRAAPPAELVAVRLSRPSDRSFMAFDSALAHVTGNPLPDETSLLFDQALLDVMVEFPIASDASEFALESDLARLGLRTTTTLRFLPPDSPERAFTFSGDPGRVTLDPRWHQAAWHFVALGFEHILGGIDHLLFLLCLIAPFRRFKELVLIVTAFTVAHSITLVGAALGFAPDALWFPPLVETLIAASILYMAAENIVMSAARRETTTSGRVPWLASGSLRRRWVLTCFFGLIHGFGFSFALGETLQFAGSHLVTSLVAFNVGVELGQVFAIAIMLPVLALAYRYAVPERMGIILVSALVAHTAWHWMVERGANLGGYAWSIQDTMLAADTLRWTMRIVAVAGVVWLGWSMGTRGTRGTKGTKGTRSPKGSVHSGEDAAV